jgi:hypothetical protein
LVVVDHGSEGLLLVECVLDLFGGIGFLLACATSLILLLYLLLTHWSGKKKKNFFYIFVLKELIICAKYLLM